MKLPAMELLSTLMAKLPRKEREESAQLAARIRAQHRDLGAYADGDETPYLDRIFRDLPTTPEGREIFLAKTGALDKALKRLDELLTLRQKQLLERVDLRESLPKLPENSNLRWPVADP